LTALSATAASVLVLAVSRARVAVGQALRAGVMESPARCPRCGHGPVQAHHADYSKPLEVTWLCQRCHARETARVRECARGVLPRARRYSRTPYRKPEGV
jgi:ribosomal protein S27AE